MWIFSIDGNMVSRSRLTEAPINHLSRFLWRWRRWHCQSFDDYCVGYRESQRPREISRVPGFSHRNRRRYWSAHRGCIFANRDLAMVRFL